MIIENEIKNYENKIKKEKEEFQDFAKFCVMMSKRYLKETNREKYNINIFFRDYTEKSLKIQAYDEITNTENNLYFEYKKENEGIKMSIYFCDFKTILKESEVI